MGTWRRQQKDDGKSHRTDKKIDKQALIILRSKDVMYFEDIQKLSTVVDLEDINRDPDHIFLHFMNYADEVFYVLKEGFLFGIVTPKDYMNGGATNISPSK